VGYALDPEPARLGLQRERHTFDINWGGGESVISTVEAILEVMSHSSAGQDELEFLLQTI